jgi:hypothetical protein
MRRDQNRPSLHLFQRVHTYTLPVTSITPLPGRTIIRRHRVTNRPTLPGGSELRIVALTARGMRAEHQRAFDAGCDDLIANAGLIRTEDSRREAPSFRTRRQGHSSGTVGGLPDTPPAQKCRPS